MTQGRGFTLVELIVAVSLLAVVASIAVPSFHDLLQRSRITGNANLLLAHIQLARFRAILDSSTFVICPSLDGSKCDARNSSWSQGWLVFRDESYQLPPQRNPEDTLLVSHRNNKSWTSVKTSLTHIRYSPGGSARNGSLVLCSDENAQTARAIIISITGRARISKSTANGAALSCT